MAWRSDGSLGSSVQGEQRAFTVLLLGSTLRPEEGGATRVASERTMALRQRTARFLNVPV